MRELRKLREKDRAKINAYMKRWYCQMEDPAKIPPEKLNRNEGRYRCGDKDVLAQAFKSYQGRVYGVEGSISEKRTFFAGAATVKKTQKANNKVIKRAVDRVASVLQFIPKASV